MSLKTIVVFLDQTPAGRDRLAYGVALAREQDARIVGVLVLPPFSPADTAAGSALGRMAIGQLIDSQDEKERSASDEARAMLDDICDRAGVAHEFRAVRESLSLHEVSHHVLHADLILVGAGRCCGLPEGGAADQFLMSTGIPFLLVPPGWRAEAPRNVVLGWNASRAARRAVSDALPLLRRADLVTVLVVDAERREGHGEDPGADLATFLGRHGVTAEVLRQSSGGARVAQVIADTARRQHADLLVLGAYGRGRMAEVVFGGVTRSMLQSCPVPLLIAH